MTDTVALIGLGTIGEGWGLAFASAGHPLRLHDADTTRAMQAAERIGREVAGARVEVRADLAEAVAGVAHVQESIAETIDAKTALFAELGRLAPPSAVLASSSSALLPSAIFAGLDGAERALVAHPFNPPHVMRAVEIVPSPRTSEATIARAADLLSGIGQVPLVVRKEVPGYVMNRLQAAVVGEAMHLVAEGVVSPEELDRAFPAALGWRWGVMGPFETMDLNAEQGFEAYVDRFGASYQQLTRTLCVDAPWTPEAVAAVAEARRRAVPRAALQERRRWRDRMVRAVAALTAGRGARG
ncbi:3-hydroxyacyl-CoA dehydrogenase NAD-binding domain-containing protein [Rhodosalinus halophilus]|nr:3-hydroxyacyl-CoA dehydrogenase NAD-binding domain-containing protein [Rhodosalinus halophilus]